MSIAGDVLDVLFDLGQLLPRPFETKYAWNRRLRYLAWNQYRDSMRSLERHGYIRVEREKDKKFVQMTKKGELKILLARAAVPSKSSWDGKWRLIMFDIPERYKSQRHVFRRLLKLKGYRYLQASVYISPEPLNREAIEYLKKTGLIEYIRMLRVDDMEDDKDLKKMFKL